MSNLIKNLRGETRDDEKIKYIFVSSTTYKYVTTKNTPLYCITSPKNFH